MFLLVPFQSIGWIFGPLMLLLGLFAVVLCVRATSRFGDLSAAKRALFASILPFAAGICGVVVGLIVWLATGANEPEKAWLALGNCGLSGLMVSALPLAWSGLLVRGRRSLA